MVTIAYRWWGAFGAEWSMARISYGADTRAEQLLIGCGLAVLLPHVRQTVRAGVAISAAALLALFVLWPGDQTHEAYLYGGSTVVALLVGLLIAHVVQSPTSALGRSLRFRAFTWVGQLPPIAALGEWSAVTLRSTDPCRSAPWRRTAQRRLGSVCKTCAHSPAPPSVHRQRGERVTPVIRQPAMSL